MNIHRSKGWLKSFLFFSGFLALSIFCSAQMGFNMQEKQMIERHKRANSSFLEGREKFEKGDMAKAEKFFKKCIAILPEHADAYFYLAQIDYKAGVLDSALKNIEAALNNFNEMAKFQIFQHELLLKTLMDDRQKLEERKANFEAEVAKLPPGSQDGTLGRAIDNAKNEINKIDSRIAEERVPPVVAIPASYYYVKGNICFKLKRYDDSMRLYQEAIKSDPKHTNAYNNLANLCYMFQKYEEALKVIADAESNGVKVNQDLKTAILKALGR